jgi:hypothetical protein
LESSTHERVNNDDFLLNVLFARKLLPTDEDVTGAAYGLLRLQMTYQLDTLDMADGRIVSSGWKINSSSHLTGMLLFKVVVFICYLNSG